MQYQLVKTFKAGFMVTKAEAEKNDKRQMIVGFFSVGIFMITAFVFLMWKYQSNKNARNLGATGMQFTPGWAVGYYFIPIINFWKPYQAMKEIWNASKFPHNWENKNSESILAWWWFFWILSNIAGQSLFKSVFIDDTIESILKTTTTAIITDIITIPLWVILYFIVDNINDMQNSKQSK